jgi:non-specific serine/threonine protein kinase
MATTLNQLGLVAHARDKGEQARAFLRRSTELRREIGDQRGLAECFESTSRLLVEDGELDRPTRLLAKAESLREAMGTPLPPRLTSLRDSMLETLRDGLGEDAFTRTWSEGRHMPADQLHRS